MTQYGDAASVIKKEKPLSLKKVVQKAVIKCLDENDPWKEYQIEKIPAERIIRHLYDPILQKWTSDETIVKIEKEPFTHGSMRYCYRMKKRSPPPSSATNHRFHQFGWQHACKYVAKAYVASQGIIDTSGKAKQLVKNDIMLQCEAQYWANQFNNEGPTLHSVSFIRAYAIEFPDRPGSPWLSCERYITGTDRYGAGYVKHNTNSGYVDTSIRRVTPQVFSAYTFYKSNGNRLVADIQGVADLYTDPMILSQDYRYGDGDLGPRGMALFFYSYRHCGISDSFGIPIFALSKNELHCQAKYEDDEETMSSCTGDTTGSSFFYRLDRREGHSYKRSHHLDQLQEDQQVFFDDHELDDEPVHRLESSANKFQKLDINRQRRASGFTLPKHIHAEAVSSLINEHDEKTARRSNVVAKTRETSSKDTLRWSVRESLLKSVSTTSSNAISKHNKSKKDTDDINQCIQRAQKNYVFTHRDYHRDETGRLKERTNFKDRTKFHKSAKVHTVLPPMKITEETRINLGRVHYQLAILQGMGRFPEIVTYSSSNTSESIDCSHDDHDMTTTPDHDVYSVLFHLSYAAAFHNVPAMLAIARVQVGLSSSVSALLHKIVPINFDSAKILLKRAMNLKTGSKINNRSYREDSNNYSSSVGKYTSYKPKVAAGCLYYQILYDESQLQINTIPAVDSLMLKVLSDTLKLYQLMEKEQEAIMKHKQVLRRTTIGFQVGDHVQANYMLEGTYYPGIITDIVDKQITVRYDYNGSVETLCQDDVRFLVPPTATQTTLGGPLSDEDAYSSCNAQDNADDSFILQKYELLYELSEIQARVGEYEEAAELCEEASKLAMKDGQMKKAAEWSLKAMEYKS